MDVIIFAPRVSFPTKPETVMTMELTVGRRHASSLLCCRTSFKVEKIKEKEVDSLLLCSHLQLPATEIEPNAQAVVCLINSSAETKHGARTWNSRGGSAAECCDFSFQICCLAVKGVVLVSLIYITG